MPISGTVKTISPELALVDALLRPSETDAASESCDTGGCSPQPNRHRPPSPTAREMARREALGSARRTPLPQGSRNRVVLALSLSVALLVVALAGVGLNRGEGPRAAGEQASAVAESGWAQRTTNERPRGTAGVGPGLRWRPVTGAEFYNVILWRNGQRALDLWPKNAAADLSDRQLPPGEYRWYVYPALTTKSGTRYGPVIAQGTLKV